MRFKLTITMMSVLTLALGAGTATAGDGQDESILELDLEVLGAGKVYIAQDGSLWEEANGMPGLQSAQIMYKSMVMDPDAPLLLL